MMAHDFPTLIPSLAAQTAAAPSQRQPSLQYEPQPWGVNRQKHGQT